MKPMLPPHPLITPAPLVGLVGLARAGKDSAYQIAAALRPGKLCRVAFADALKRQVAAAFGVSVEEVERQKSVFRATLQAWGVLRREYCGASYWVDRVGDTVDAYRRSGKAVFIPDCRFQNEARWIREQGGVLVRIVRPHFGPAAPPHISETEQTGIQVDYTIEAVTLPELETGVKDLLPKLGL